MGSLPCDAGLQPRLLGADLETILYLAGAATAGPEWRLPSGNWPPRCLHTLVMTTWALGLRQHHLYILQQRQGH